MSTSKSPILDDDTDPEDLTDRQLLERIASRDPDKYPLARRAQRALDRLDQEGGQS